MKRCLEQVKWKKLLQLSNELQQVEWNLNEESVPADNAEATVHSLREHYGAVFTVALKNLVKTQEAEC